MSRKIPSSYIKCVCGNEDCIWEKAIGYCPCIRWYKSKCNIWDECINRECLDAVIWSPQVCYDLYALVKAGLVKYTG